MKRFPLPSDEIVQEDDPDNGNEGADWAQEVLSQGSKSKRQKLRPETRYFCSMLHIIAPTSNMCGRLFSRTKLIM